MASKIHISADTTEAKKSILALSKTVKDVKSSDITIFSADDKKFIKEELGKELGAMKDKLKSNQREIGTLIKEHKKLQTGSDAELKSRQKIIDAYKTQKRLASEMVKLEQAQDQPGSRIRTGVAGAGRKPFFGGAAPGGRGGGLMGRMGGMIGRGGMTAAGMTMAGLGAGAIGLLGAGAITTVQSGLQWMQGAPIRNAATGLGLNERSRLRERDIANAGLNEQEFLQRRVQMARIAGQGAGDERQVLQQARFERAFGIEEGTMTGVTAGLRGAFGTDSNEAQAKLQASILASGIEDAIGPYLESATQLLAQINENGMQNTDELIRTMAGLARDESRTPEQIARTIQNVDQSVRGSTGEANAFLQAAFARGGIGGGTIGGARFAIESGGITGLSRRELAERGMNTDLINNMGRMGMFGGVGQRSEAILQQFRRSGGLAEGQRIQDVTDPSQMIGLANMANAVFGTQGMGGFDALTLFEKMQNKQISRNQFDEKLKEVKEGKNPQVERLDKINATLAGQTEILSNLSNILRERIGVAVAGTTIGLQTAKVGLEENLKKNVELAAPGVNAAAQGTGDIVNYVATGKLGGDLHDAVHGFSTSVSKTFDSIAEGFGNAIREMKRTPVSEQLDHSFSSARDWVSGLFSDDKDGPKKSIKMDRNIPDLNKNIPTRKDTTSPEKAAAEQADMIAKKTGDAVGKAISKQKQPNINNVNKNNIRIQMGDGRVQNRTHK